MFTHGHHYYKGRVALHVILRALGIGEGDEVIVPGFTCLAVPLPILHLNAKPVYIDIESSSYNMDISQLGDLITPRTKVIIAQHTFGIPLPMPVLMATANQLGLSVIEDCCHTMSSTIGGKVVGSFGDAAFSSYEWGKPLMIGCGGSAFSKDCALREKLEIAYRESHAPTPMETMTITLERFAYQKFYRPSLFWVLRRAFRALGRLGLTVRTFEGSEMLGQMRHINKRMPGFAERILKTAWEGLSEDERRSQRLVGLYKTGLREIGVACPASPSGANVIYSRYPLQVRDKGRVLREAARSRIEVGDWFTEPVHPVPRSQWAQVGYTAGSCPVAETTVARIISLPLHRRILLSEVERTIEFLARMKHEGAL